jgi:hypothetical protein
MKGKGVSMEARQKLQAAVKEGLFVTINEILTLTPALIKQEDLQGSTIFYDVVFAQKFEVADYLLNHAAYQALPMPEKQELLRDLLDACLSSAQEAYIGDQLDKAKEILAKALYYNKKIVDKTDEDYRVFSNVLCLTAAVHLKQKQGDKAFDLLQEAIFIQNKTKFKTEHDYQRRIFCLNALGRQYAKKGQRAEAIKAFNEALYYCCQLSFNSQLPFLSVVEKNLRTLCRSALATELNSWGYEGRPTKEGDKNSLLSAIIDQLVLQGFTPEDILAENLVSKTQTMYLNLSREADGGNEAFYHYLNKLIYSGAWTKEQAFNLLAFSRALNMNIIVICSNAEPLILKQKQPLKTLFLGHENGQIYQSLCLRADRLEGRSLQKYFNEAVADNYYQKQRKIGSPVSFSSSGKDEKQTEDRRTWPSRKRTQTKALETALDESDSSVKYQKMSQKKRGHSEVEGKNSSEKSLAKMQRFFKGRKAEVASLDEAVDQVVSYHMAQ